MFIGEQTHIRISQYVGLFSILNELTGFTVELRDMPTLVNVVFPLSFNVDTPLRLTQQLVECRLSRHQSNTGDTNHQNIGPPLRTV